MTDDKDIRRQQRVSNFNNSYDLLAATLKLEQLSDAERAGLIQFFEMTFELSWKMLKDYLTAEGFSPQSPRAAIKQAFASELITDGEGWMDMLQCRSRTSLTYDEAIAREIEADIKNHYHPLFNDLAKTLSTLALMH
jgi:nucleotidyltransferase substrate binding protein (TIGR01987 family)